MLERKLASIQKIISLTDLENTSNLQHAQVLGWKCVINRGMGLKVGDLCIYIEIDSVMPQRLEFDFLKEKKYRVKTIRIRGYLSQGLILPLSYLNKVALSDNILVVEGDDVTEILGITKYVNPEFDMSNKKGGESSEKVEKDDPFPDFLIKTDEIRIQSAPELIKELRFSSQKANEL